MAGKIGTAYVDIHGDLSTLHKQMGAALTPAAMKKYGKLAGAGVAVGLAGAVGKGLFDLGKDFDDAFDRIRVGTGKTGAPLKRLKNDFKATFKSLPTDMESASTAITELNRRTGQTGKPLRALSKQMLQLSDVTKTDLKENIAATTRLFGDWGVETDKQGKTVDKLFRLTQNTGVGFSELERLMVKFGAPLRSLGIDFDHSAAMFARFEREGVNIQTTMPGLRMALKNFALAGKEPEKALQATFDKIKQLGPGAESTSLAFKTFGVRAGTDMLRGILEGRFELDKMVESMNKGKDSVDKAEKSTRDFGEQWKLLRNKLQVKIEPIASAVFKGLGDGMEALANFKVPESFRSTFANIKSIITSLNPVWNFMGSVAKRTLGGIAQFFRGWGQALKGVTDFIAGLLKGDFSRMWSGIKNVFRAGLNGVLGIFRVITAPIREIASRAGRAMSGPFRTAKNAIGDAVDGVRGALGGLGRFFSRLAGGAFKTIKDAIKAIVEVLGKIVGAARDAANWLGKVKDKAPSLHDVVPFDPTPGFDIPGIAKGGPASGLALVGERGPELVSLPDGSFVHKNSDSKKIAKTLGIPGFAGGGMVRIPGDPNTTGGRDKVNRDVVDLAEYLVKTFGIQIGYAYDPGGGHSSAGHNVTGRAADAHAWKTGWGGVGRAVGWATAKGMVVGYDGSHGSQSWSGHGPPAKAGSNAHAHFELKPGVKFGGSSTRGRRGGGTIRGGTLSLGQLVTLAQKTGFPNPALAAAVAMAESSGKVSNVGDGGDSLGLWQINTPAHPSYSPDKLAHDAFYNAKAALAISNHGKNWNPWTVYKTGAYKQFLGGKAAPLPGGTGGGGAAGGGGPSKADTSRLAQLEYQLARARKKSDKLRVINKLIAYWRKRHKSAKSVGNWAAAKAALDSVKDYQEQRREVMRGEEELYQLGGLSSIGKGKNAWHIGGMQRVLDGIELRAAQAALTEPGDDSQAALSASLQDDIAAATQLRTVWEGIYGLTLQRGTPKQQLEAATNLATARSTLKGFTDDANKPADVAAVDNSVLNDLLKQQLDAKNKDLAIALAQLPIFKRFATAPFAGIFHGGGTVPGPIGAERTILTQAGETVLPRGATGNVTVVLEKGAIVGGEVDPSKVRVVINDEIASMARKATSGPAVGRKHALV